MNDIEIGWLTGIIDGEGSITINKRKRTDAKHKFDGYSMRINVSNTDPRMIDRLMKIARVGSKNYVQEARTDRCSKVYTWVVAAQKAKYILEIIKPFIVCKKEQVELALNFQNHITNNKKTWLTSEETQIRDNYYHEMKKLNVKGREREKLYMKYLGEIL